MSRYTLVNSTTSSISLRKGGLSSLVAVYSIVYGVSNPVMSLSVDALEGDGVGSMKQSKNTSES